MVGGWRLARSFPEMSESQKNEPPRNEMLLAYRYIAVHTVALLTAVVGWPMDGGWVVGALGGAWRLGGSLRTWVNCFVLWGVELPMQVLPYTNFKTNTIYTNFNIKIPVYYRTYCSTAVRYCCYVWCVKVGRPYKTFPTLTLRLIQSTLISISKSLLTAVRTAALLLS